MADHREMHDKLIATKPSDMSQAEFDEVIEAHKQDCPFCNETIENNKPEGRGDNMGETFTQEELDAAVEAAVAPVQAKLDELDKFLAESEVDDRVAAAQAEGEIKVAEIQAELDKAMNEAGTAREELESTLQYFADLQELAELNELYEARKLDRKTRVSEVASFSDDYVEANIDRWAAMADEDFEATIADWQAMPAQAAQEQEEQDFGRSTAMQNVRPASSSSVASDLGDILAARKHGFNIKRLK